MSKAAVKKKEKKQNIIPMCHSKLTFEPTGLLLRQRSFWLGTPKPRGLRCGWLPSCQIDDRVRAKLFRRWPATAAAAAPAARLSPALVHPQDTLRAAQLSALLQVYLNHLAINEEPVANESAVGIGARFSQKWDAAVVVWYSGRTDIPRMWNKDKLIWESFWFVLDGFAKYSACLFLDTT